MIGGLWQRLEELSWLYQQEETAEQQSGDLTLLILQGLCKLAADMSDIKDNSDIRKTAWTFSTSQISEAVQSIAKNTEADIEIDAITSRKVGRLLGKLRLRKTREAGKGTRQWQITLNELERWSAVYGIHLPVEVTPQTNVTHVTDGLTSQGNLIPWANCEIALRVPADSLLPTVGGFWRRLPDGRIEAGYSLDQLAMVLSIFLDKDIDAEKIADSPLPQLKERLIAVTGAEILHIRLPEKAEGTGDG